MALKVVNPDYQAFEFITNSLKRLELWGALLTWQDEHNTGLAEHLILKREGAIHQRTVTPPRKYTFRCVFVSGGGGASVGDRYRALADALAEDPTGRLIHPRFGSLRAVVETIQAAEQPEQANDEVVFTLRISESGLRTEPRPSAGSVAAGAMATTTTFVSALPVSFVLYGAALRKAVFSLVSKITAAVTLPASIETHRALAEVADHTAAIQRTARIQGRYDIYAQAAIAYRQAAESVRASEQARPRTTTYTTKADTSLPRLCALLYGGRHARSQAAQILAVNHIQNPAHIPSGTTLTITDPEALRRGTA